MVRFFGSLLGTVVIGTTVFTINLVFMGIASLLRLLPLLFPLAGRVVWGILVFSCRLYYMLLVRAAPLVERHAKIKILGGLWRMGVTLGMSLALGFIFLLLTRFPITWWTVLPLILHGLFVDFAWDEIPGLGALETGTRL